MRSDGALGIGWGVMGRDPLAGVGQACDWVVASQRRPTLTAANVNNWHWSELDLAGWAKKRLTALLVGVAAQVRR